MIPRKQGFTLLEILVAITIFGMVIGLAYSSYNATFHIINSAESQIETYSKARITMERILGDLESFYPGKKIHFKGTGETLANHRAATLQFLSTAHIRLHPDSAPRGPVLIRYQVLEDPDSDSLLFYRAEQSLTDATKEEEEDPPGLLLCDNLQEVAFDYRNEDGEDVESWGEDEEGEDAASLPDLVTISLRFNDAEEGSAGTFFQTGIRLPAAAK
jgi:prepilin-type N-terminal cleavage/methylation domain-containing protein